ncbi:FeMo cofactor biosynthesis protein NifB [Planctomycetes bacterium CA13]|uniref:FeMo cofactor biosynthesis protein NifB n=1 Tax=Novipirellula herctigrandis TaxID=2527986 RepID=A0A5C5Z8S6_9BACT|nr:FeMo cofactor biosynthesis protein NifB [Planctomycetes bacterium CA13]
MTIDTSRHPCFSASAKHKFGRVHLPVAPKCNISCNFCNRKFDCANESRPGVTSTVLSPAQSAAYLSKVKALVECPITVVGIAGPGDPFANAEETMETLRLVRESDPDIILCIASNGLNLEPYVEELAELKTSHVTVTVNAVDPKIGAQIYRWVRPQPNRVYRGEEGAKYLLDCQLASINALKRCGITVKINTIVMPGVNDHHITEITQVMADLGVDVQNCMALVPVEGTPFENLEAPEPKLMMEIRKDIRQWLPQMSHCARCRADAVGLLGEANSDLVQEALIETATSPLNPAENRPYVAVASLEGMLVNQHLGESEQLWIFERAADGSFEMIETRPTPLPGSGSRRWKDLANRLTDCRAVLAAHAGPSPKTALAKAGIRVMVAEGLIDEALELVFAGKKPRMPLRVAADGSGCDSDGVGCGPCSGPGTGCG